MASQTQTDPPRTRLDARFWIFGLLPLALLAIALYLFSQFGTVGVFDAAFPPIEELNDRASPVHRRGH